MNFRLNLITWRFPKENIRESNIFPKAIRLKVAGIATILIIYHIIARKSIFRSIGSVSPKDWVLIRYYNLSVLQKGYKKLPHSSLKFHSWEKEFFIKSGFKQVPNGSKFWPWRKSSVFVDFLFATIISAIKPIDKPSQLVNHLTVGRWPSQGSKTIYDETSP